MRDPGLATDPVTGETGRRRVARQIVTADDEHVNELNLATPDGPRKLTATRWHPSPASPAPDGARRWG